MVGILLKEEITHFRVVLSSDLLSYGRKLTKWLPQSIIIYYGMKTVQKVSQWESKAIFISLIEHNITY